MAHTSNTSVSSKSPSSDEKTDDNKAGEKQLDTAELIDRMAMERRVASDSGLPLAYFVDQVKRELAGTTPANEPVSGPDRKKTVNSDSSVFHAWALPE